jgi:hypothetical protein
MLICRAELTIMYLLKKRINMKKNHIKKVKPAKILTLSKEPGTDPSGCSPIKVN